MSGPARIDGEGVRVLRCDWVITMDSERRVIAEGAVAIDGKRIAAVGEAATVMERFPEAPVRDHPGMVMLPGLLDSHGHAGHSFTRTLGAGRPGLWAEICEEVYAHASDERFWGLSGMLLGLERLRAGITTGVTFLGGGGQILTGDMPMRTDSSRYADAFAASIELLGTRETIVVGPRRSPFPRRYTQREDGRAHEVKVGFDDQVAVCGQVFDRWHGAVDGRIEVAMMSHTVHPSIPGEDLPTLEREARTMADLARELGVPLMQDGHTSGSVAHLHERVARLGPDIFLSHATELTAEEIALCAETGAVVVHNPSAVASSLGRCPVPELTAAGALVTLGSDAAGPDRGCDLFRHMFHCMRSHRQALRDPSVMPEGRMLEMVTIDAARALGCADRQGSIEPGKLADLILVDATGPHLRPLTMPVNQLVNYASGSDVDTVLVGGRELMRGRRILTVDDERLLDEADEVWRVVWERCEIEQPPPTPEFWSGRRPAMESNHARA